MSKCAATSSDKHHRTWPPTAQSAAVTASDSDAHDRISTPPERSTDTSNSERQLPVDETDLLSAFCHNTKNDNKLQEKTHLFRRINTKFHQFCKPVFQAVFLYSHGNVTLTDVTAVLDQSLRVDGYKFVDVVDGRDCVLLGLDPLLFRRVLRDRNCSEKVARARNCHKHFVVRNLPFDVITTRNSHY